MVSTYLPGKEPHRQVGAGKVVASGSLAGAMVSTLARNVRHGFDSRYTIFITPHDLGNAERQARKRRNVNCVNVDFDSAGIRTQRLTKPALYSIFSIQYSVFSWTSRHCGETC